MRFMGFRLGAAGFGLGLLLAGCQTIPPNTGKALEFDEAERPAAASDFPNWPADPRIIDERGPGLLGSNQEKVMELERTQAGTSGALSVVLYFPSIDKDVRIKWKPVPTGSLDEYNNSARKQIAAYELQKLFLDAEDWLVPSAIAHCVPLPKYVRVAGGGRPTVAGTNCVLGAASVWLQNVTPEENLYDEQRFVSDPVYAYYMANFNLLTYLIDHSDPKRSNFLVSKEPDRRHVFSIDNDLAFDEVFRNFFPSPWHVIFVPALRHDSIARLRTLSREDLDVLGVVAQLEKDRYGILRHAEPGENLGPNRGVRIKGGVVQLGLSRAEIDALWDRMQALFEKIDRQEIATF